MELGMCKQAELLVESFLLLASEVRTIDIVNPSISFKLYALENKWGALSCVYSI